MAFWRSDMTGRAQQRRKARPCPGCAEKSQQIALLTALVTEQAAAIAARSAGRADALVPVPVGDPGASRVPDVEETEKRARAGRS